MVAEIWKIMTLLIVMNSRNVPASAHATNLGVHGGDPWHRGGYEENIGPIQCVNIALCILERVWPITRHADNGTVVFSRGI